VMMQAGQTPAILFSLPGNKSQLLALDSREITRLVRLVCEIAVKVPETAGVTHLASKEFL
jgi:hypothetical protein